MLAEGRVALDNGWCAGRTIAECPQITQKDADSIAPSQFNAEAQRHRSWERARRCVEGVGPCGGSPPTAGIYNPGLLGRRWRPSGPATHVIL